jgi:PAS domain S-box-containing protein
MVATVEKVKGRDVVLVLGGILLMADALGLDLSMPLDLAIGVPYALVVLLGLWWPTRGYIYTAAIVGSGLCLLGFYPSLAGGELGPALINRSFALLTIWIVAVLCLFQKQAQNKKLELQKLIDHIGQIVSGEMVPRKEDYLFKNILKVLLSFTESRYGVIGEVLENEEGQPYFRKKAGMAMDFFVDFPEGVAREESLDSQETEPYNMTPLFDEVIQSGKPLLLKEVSPAVSKTPMVSGYRPMESFMGLPFFQEGRMLGVVGIANRVGGYDRCWVETLKPFLAASAGNIHLFRVGREQREAENALRENSLKLQEMEKDAGLLQSAMENKDARLADVEEQLRRSEETLKENEDRIRALIDERDQDEEELNRVRESLRQVQEELAITKETLRGKEEQVVRTEGDRNRTAEALLEKEERLMQVMSDFNQLEQDLKGESETITCIEEDLQQVQDKLRGKDLQIEEMENRLGETQDQLRAKERRVAQVEDEMSQVKNALQEKERRYQQMEFEKTDLESHLREYETRLSKVERELALTKKILRDREGHLARIGKEIRDTLARKEEDLFPVEPERVKPREWVFQRKEDWPSEEPKKSDDAAARLQDLIAHDSGQGICGLDLQGNTTFINPAGAKMLGYGSGELIGKNQHATIHHSRVDGTPFSPGQCHICNALADGVVSHVVDEVFWRKDGSSFPVEYLCAPIVENKRRIGAVVTFSDISCRNQNEKSRDSFRIDFNQNFEEPMPVPPKNYGRLESESENGKKAGHRFEHPVRDIEPGNQEMREFATIASHDLQEPLRKIIGFGSRLQKDCGSSLDDRGRDYLDRMERAAHQMQKFIGDLLQYSKVTAQTIPHQRVDLRDVIADVLVDLELRIEETQAKIEIDTLPVIEADPIQMRQLFQNLLSNALKFHKEGELPIVSVRHRLLGNGLHEIRVEDQGIGFDEQYLQRIFKPFERLHGKMEYEGTGMGLAICQKIVHRHGGEITATSSLQKGTTFIITLPARQTLA